MTKDEFYRLQSSAVWNHLRDLVKHKNRGRRAEESRNLEFNEDFDASDDQPPDLDTDQAVDQIVSRLPPIQQEIYRLRQQGTTWEAIKKMLQIKRRRFEAERNQLRKSIEKGLWKNN